MKRILLTLIIIVNIQSVIAQSTNKFSIKNLESNQPYPDKGIAFFDNDFIVFSAQIENSLGEHSRKRKRNKKKNIELLSQNLDFYFTPIDDSGSFVNNQKLNNVINSKHDDYGLVFSNDQSIVYFSREAVMKNSKEKHLELFKANVISPGSWVNIRKLNINHPSYSVGYPCLSTDDKTLYYVSNIEGDFDIYKVRINDEGELEIPTKLSSNINSSSNETTPFIFDNKLYFSSDREGGLGGFDIYSVNLNDKTSKIVRIEEPINSIFNDFNFVKKNLTQGFFVSDRSGGKGKEDIYFFKENNENSLALAAAKTRSANKIFQDEEEKMLASNKATKSELNSLPLKSQSENDKLTTSKTNSSSITVKEKVKYVKNDTVYDFQRRVSYDVHREKEIVVDDSTSASFEKKDKSKNEYNKCQIEFDKINNVYFDYSESYIRADAAVELDKVIRVLRLCPKIILQASSHTDSRASNSYNLKLSQSRADSVVRYILRNGHFTPNRIVSKGYGEERLSNKCTDGVKCTEKEHQLNRRTHFEIYNY